MPLAEAVMAVIAAMRQTLTTAARAVAAAPVTSFAFRTQLGSVRPIVALAAPGLTVFAIATRLALAAIVDVAAMVIKAAVRLTTGTSKRPMAPTTVVAARSPAASARPFMRKAVAKRLLLAMPARLQFAAVVNEAAVVIKAAMRLTAVAIARPAATTAIALMRLRPAPPA